VDDLLNPTNNAVIAMDIFNAAGGKWWPWAVGANGGWDANGDPWRRTESFQPLARDAISQANVGDVDAMVMASMMPRSSGGGGGGVNFNNTFQISAGSGGAGSGGLDVRRTVTMIADELENEMKRRMARVN
jgi:hypothetical protein